MYAQTRRLRVPYLDSWAIKDKDKAAAARLDRSDYGVSVFRHRGYCSPREHLQNDEIPRISAIDSRVPMSYHSNVPENHVH